MFFLLKCLCLYFKEGRHLVYEKISQAVKQAFNSLIAKYPVFQSCSSSLAAFIIEKGKCFDLFSVIYKKKAVYSVHASKNLETLNML